MTIGFEDFAHKVVIKVVGVGGGGIEAVKCMIKAGVKDVEFITVDTGTVCDGGIETVKRISKSDGNYVEYIDVYSSTSNPFASSHIKLGDATNFDSESVAKEADEHSEEILYALRGADMVFIVAGMGGVTGNGVAPIVARCAKKLGALTVGVVTCPYSYRESIPSERATRGIENLRRTVDQIIVIPNEKIFGNLDKTTSLADAFKVVDDIICQGVRAICDLVSDAGYVNLDFTDVKSVLSNANLSFIGIGEAVGKNAPVAAIREAIKSPLMEDQLCDSKGIIISFVGNASHLNMMELNEAAQSIAEEAHPEANILWGVSVDDNMGDTIRAVVVATSPRKQYP